MAKTKQMLMLDQNLFKSHLNSTFVLPQTTKQNDMTHAIEVEVTHKIIITTKTTIHKTDIALHLEIDRFSDDKSTTQLSTSFRTQSFSS